MKILLQIQKNITLKQNILRTSIIIAKAKNVSVLHDINTKHIIEREENNSDTEDINTMKQESSSVINRRSEYNDYKRR